MKGPTNAPNPEAYIAALEEPRRAEIQRVHEIIREVAPNLEPFMYCGMIGYGLYRYKYESGREGDGARLALASQKQYISLYGCGSVSQAFKELLPKADIGKGCVRFKRLSDLDEANLREMIHRAAVSRSAI